MKYIGFYDIDDNRNVSLAAINKMNYISQTANKIGYDIEIISCAATAGKKIESKKVKIFNKTTVNFFKTHKKSKWKWKRIYDFIWQNIKLFFYLFFNTYKRESIIVYHSLSLMRCIGWIKKIKKVNLILEVEEIYNDVVKKSNYAYGKEIRFIKSADKYIFPTELLNQKLNFNNKPYVIVHGTYRAEIKRNVSFNDSKIHVVYAGTFDPRKGGATAAVNAVKWLPNNYHIHILGFGNDENTKAIKKQIYEVNLKSKATVTYEGALTGEDYICFIQKCDIGLSTQNPDADFNATSFPSKILSYMANGLRVISIKIPAIESSAVGDDMYYYKEQTPQEIAKAIQIININDQYNSRKKINILDKMFQKELKKLIENKI